MFEWIEWIGHWDELRFYYSSPLNGLSWLVLLPVYVVAAALIALLRCREKHSANTRLETMGVSASNLQESRRGRVYEALLTCLTVNKG